METTRKEDIIYWHLPGLCYFRALNQVLMNLMKDYPEHFREGYRIGSVYGTIPGAVWNGGRAVFGFVGKGDIQRVLDLYNSRGIPARFTWTNSLLEEKHLQDTYCNLIMRLGDNGLNQVLVNRDVPACGFSIGFERIILLLTESGFQVPSQPQKVAYLIEKGVEGQALGEVIAKAQAARAEGTQVLVARMIKNKKFQKEQLTREGYQEFVEIYRESLKF